MMSEYKLARQPVSVRKPFGIVAWCATQDREEELLGLGQKLSGSAKQSSPLNLFGDLEWK